MLLPEDISILEVADDHHTLAAAERVLSVDECIRRDGFRNDGRKRAFTLGRYAVRTQLGEAMSCDARAVDLQVREDGSIGIAQDRHFASISHSGPYAAAAVAPYPVGIDLERVRPRPEALFRFVLHPDEAGLRSSVDLPSDTQLVLFWALKEAVLKAQRTGLRMSPKALRLSDVDLSRGSASIHGDRKWNGCFAWRQDYLVAVVW